MLFISAFFYHLTFNICHVTILTFSKLGQCQFKTFLGWILSQARKLIIRKKNVGVGNVATATTAALFLHTVVSTKYWYDFLISREIVPKQVKVRKFQMNFFWSSITSKTNTKISLSNFFPSLIMIRSYYIIKYFYFFDSTTY